MERESDKNFFYYTFLSFLQNSTDMIYVKDTNLTYMASSIPFAKLAGLDGPEDVVGRTDFELFEPELAKRYTDDDRTILSTGVPSVNYIEPTPDQGNQKRYCSTSKYVIRDLGGKIIGIYGISRDVTAQIELEEEREIHRLSRRMFDAVWEGDLTKDKVLDVGDTDWGKVLGLREGESFSATMERVGARFIHPDYREAFWDSYRLERLKAAYDKGIPEFIHRTCFCGLDKNSRWVECKTNIYHSYLSNTLRTTTLLRDIDDEVQETRQLEERANTDALTGLSNRASVLEGISAALGRSCPEELCALLFIDLDRFKQINDRWGHRFGDQVLQTIADRLRLVFGENDIFGRIGGDEFLVFLSGVTSRQAVEDCARQIVESVTFYPKGTDGELSVTCSVGVALSPVGEATVDRLYEYADRAMYRAKVLGQDRVFFYEE